MPRLDDYKRHIWSVARNVSVEPVVFVAMHSMVMAGVAGGLGMYRVMCDQLFNADGGTPLNNHTSFDCWDLTKGLGQGLGSNGTEWWRKAEVILQQRMATYATISLICSMLPAGMSNVLLGSIGDRIGRKSIILLNILGVAFGVVGFVIVFWAPRTTPIYLIYVCEILVGLTGRHIGLMINCQGYLNDVVTDRETLSVRMTLIGICMGVATITAPLITTAIANALGFSWTMIVAGLVGGLAWVIALFVLKRIIPNKKAKVPVVIQEAQSARNSSDISTAAASTATTTPTKNVEESLSSSTANIAENLDDEKHRERSISASSSISDQRRNCCEKIRDMLKQSKQAFSEAGRSLAKRREGHGKAYIFCMFYVAFVLAAIDMTLATYDSLYLQKAPFSWTQTKLTTFGSITSMVNLFGSLFGIGVLKKLLHLSDTLIMSIGLLSHTVKSVLFLAATTDWMIFLSSVTNVFAGLALPCMQAFIASVLSPDEMGKILGVSSIFAALAIIGGTVLIAEIYKATVATFSRCVFIIGASLTGSTFLLAVWMHLDSTKRVKNWPCCRRKKTAEP